MSSSKRDRELRKQVAGKIAQSFHVGHRVARIDFIPFFQTIFNRVPALAEDLCLRIDAEEDEIRLLMGPDAPEDLVDKVAQHVEARKQQPASQQEVADDVPAEEPAKKPAAASRSLMEF